MKIKKQKIAVLPDGKKIHLFTIKNGEMSFSATDYGCTVTSIVLPSKSGKKDDIVLGFPSVESNVMSARNSRFQLRPVLHG